MRGPNKMTHHQVEQAIHQQLKQIENTVKEFLQTRNDGFWFQKEFNINQKTEILNFLAKIDPIINQLAQEELEDEQIEEHAKQVVVRMLEQAYNTIQKAETEQD